MIRGKHMIVELRAHVGNTYPRHQRTDSEECFAPARGFARAWHCLLEHRQVQWRASGRFKFTADLVCLGPDIGRKNNSSQPASKIPPAMR